MTKTFSELKKNLKKDQQGLLRIKVALLGDSATQFLSQAIKGCGFENGLALQVWEADFNQVEGEVFNASSALYSFEADVVIIFKSSHQLLAKYNKSISDPVKFAETELNQLRGIYQSLCERTKAKVIFYNYPEIDDGVFGNYANKTEHSFLFQQRKLNFELMNWAATEPGLHLCDLSSVQNQNGKKELFDTSVYVNTQMVISIEMLPAVAQRTVLLIAAIQGKFKKCVVLDLDNTVWGGVIGDDGVENIQVGELGIGKAFTEFQYWVKKLKERGVIVAVCSKNTESVAKEPFEKHPDMVLRLEDISVFMANWETKVDNLRAIQKILSIGFDSMVFIDDNPFERNMVRQHIEGITVPEMPEDPADYVEYLSELNLFETASYSQEDTLRTRQYQVEASRAVFQKTFANEDAYLESLNMVSSVEPFNAFNRPRVAQLSQRSNQFNLRTVRYTETDIEQIETANNSHSFAFTLEDSFGTHGLISVVILEEKNKTAFINTWLMSCRVLKRGMESFVLNTIAELAIEKGLDKLEGEYIPTEKNALVKDHYAQLGFELTDAGTWVMTLADYKKKRTHIQKK